MPRTLITTVFTGDVVKIVITKLSPDKVILIGAKTEDEKRLKTIKEASSMLRKMYDFLEFETVDTDLYNIPAIVKDVMAVIDKEHEKGSEIVVHISESRKTQALGLLFACYKRKEKIKAAYYLVEETNELQLLPLLDFEVSETKQKILTLVKKGTKDIQDIIDKTKKSRAMVYAHIQELKKDGYLTEDLDLTDAGRIMVM